MKAQAFIFLPLTLPTARGNAYLSTSPGSSRSELLAYSAARSASISASTTYSTQFPTVSR
eukprot:3314854-Rhodomonas_salina.1